MKQQNNTRMAESSGGVLTKVSKMYFKVQIMFGKLQSKNKWKGPTCSCTEFKTKGKCRHLEVFKNVKSVDSTVGSEPTGYRKKRSRTQSPAGMEPVHDNNKQHSEELQEEEEANSGSSSSRFSKFSGRGARNPNENYDNSTLVVATKLAISNSPCDVGELLVPHNIKSITGHLTLLDKIGKGRCGRIIYRATTSDRGIVLAKVLKVQAPSCLPHHQQVFNNELDVLEKLGKHQSIVEFYGYQEELVKDVLERRICFEFAIDNLSELISHRATGNDRLSYLEVRKYCIDISEGLAYLHGINICHRDLSTSNILMIKSPYPASGNWTATMKKHFRLSLRALFSSSGASFNNNNHESKNLSSKHNKQLNYFEALNSAGRPVYVAKIANFEHAKTLPPGTRSRTRVTSPNFMSPEMFKGSYGISCDIWSLGCIMYEMLRKEPPFSGMNLQQVERSVTSQAFPPRQGAGAPADFKPLEMLMTTCLSYNPEQRPYAANLVDQLHREV